MPEDTTITVPNNPPEQVAATPEVTTGSAPNFSDMIPEAYRDKPYMSKIQDVDGFFKSFDSMQEMIGKRPSGIPQENASETEWGDFYKQLGRPDEASGYEVKYPEGTDINDEQLSQFKEFAHAQGLTPKQVQAIAEFDLNRQNAAMEGLSTQEQDSVTAQKADFDKMTDELFGDRKKAVMENGDKLVMKYLPEKYDEHFKNLDTKSKALMATVLDGIAKDYINEGSSVNGETATSRTSDELLQEAQKLMQAPEFKSQFHVGHNQASKRVQDIYAQLYPS